VQIVNTIQNIPYKNIFSFLMLTKFRYPDDLFNKLCWALVYKAQEEFFRYYA